MSAYGLADVKEWLGAIEFAFPAKVFCENVGMSYDGGHAHPHVRVGVIVFLLHTAEGSILPECDKSNKQQYQYEKIVPLELLTDGPEHTVDFVRRLLHEAVITVVDKGIFMYGCQPYAPKG